MKLRTVQFRPLGRAVPFLGFGCGTLNGRASLSRSARLVETALDLGIRYFDVAPSYGGGTAEEVLGHVIGDSAEVVVATKHGIPRPPYRPVYEHVRRLAKPILDGSGVIRRLIRQARHTARSSGPSPDRHDFSGEATRRSLETSLRLLRRSSVDVFLAHEPVPEDLTPETARHFADAVKAGMARCFGAAVGAMGESSAVFGAVWQSCWPGCSWVAGRSEITHVFHGALRYRDGVPCRATEADLEWRMRQFAKLAPASVLIVSASTPERLRRIVAAATP